MKDIQRRNMAVASGFHSNISAHLDTGEHIWYHNLSPTHRK